MDYNVTIEINLENVTYEDCIELYEKKNTVTILSNGEIIKFEKETEHGKY